MAEGQADEDWARMMRAAQAGDEATYRRLLGEIARWVRAVVRGAFSRANVGDAEIEDVVQETLLAVHLKRDTWDKNLKLAPWVGAIARHKIIDALRRRGARQYAPIENFESVIAAPESDDSLALSDAERLIGRLPARQQDIVRSISLNGQSIAATAARLSMSEGAVRVALHRALKSLAGAWRKGST
ncbi:MAG TPA: sigma-70 family RNA polymerase sigma factor [Roseiarcus sp.]|nr:sigma-70 family RNA polymerase sigma factor [Roseiarcus sp.]